MIRKMFAEMMVFLLVIGMMMAVAEESVKASIIRNMQITDITDDAVFVTVAGDIYEYGFIGD